MISVSVLVALGACLVVACVGLGAGVYPAYAMTFALSLVRGTRARARHGIDAAIAGLFAFAGLRPLTLGTVP